MYLAMTKQADLVSPLSVEKRKGERVVEKEKEREGQKESKKQKRERRE